MGEIYYLLDPNTYQVKYIGQTHKPDVRKAQHKFFAAQGVTNELYQAWRNSLNKKSPIYITLFESDSVEELSEIEKHVIFELSKFTFLVNKRGTSKHQVEFIPMQVNEQIINEIIEDQPTQKELRDNKQVIWVEKHVHSEIKKISLELEKTIGEIVTKLLVDFIKQQRENNHGTSTGNMGRQSKRNAD